VRGHRLLQLLGGALLAGGLSCGVSQELYNQRTLEYDRCQSSLGRAQNDLENVRKSRDELATSESKLQRDNSTLNAQINLVKKDIKATQADLERLRRASEQAERRGDVYRQLLSRLRAMIDAKTLAVEIRKGKMLVKLGDEVLFDPGKAELKSSGQQALREVAAALREIPDRDFLIAGHTDNQPIKRSAFHSNWELSTARAVNVVRFLQQEGVDPRRLAAAGFSEFDPIADNEQVVERAKNRRIEIVVMPRLEELPPIPTEEPKPVSAPPDAGTATPDAAPLLP
jgi:chemotaxis protein MotB